jgi:YD repeat-containing protein
MKKHFIALFAFLVFIAMGKAQTVQYLPLYDDATFARGLNMTDGAAPVGYSVGSTSGALDVSPTGGVSYTIPIALPPGTKGIAPSLAIAYNSQGGNGMMGMGWNFSGVSAITRVNKDMFNDGVVESISLSNSDVFALDGNKLTTLTGTYGADGTTYATKMETFSVITSFGVTTPDWFKVTAKNGMTYEYGNSTNSKVVVSPPGRGSVVNLGWYLNKAYDTYGNYIEYQYVLDGSEVKLSKILYTGNNNAGITPYNTITFNYGIRTDPNTGFTNGASVESKSLLTEIIVTTENSLLVKKYNFEYGFDNIHSYLSKVIETGSDNTQLNSTIFKYGNSTQATLLANTTVFTGEIISKGDFNGDGLTDIVTATKGMINSVSLFNAFNVYIKNATNDSFTLTKQEPIPSGFLVLPKIAYFSTISNTLTSDVNADGRDDIIVVTLDNSSSLNLISGSLKVYYPNATATSFTTATRLLSYIDNTHPENDRCTISPKNNFFLGDFNGDGKIEFISLLGRCIGGNTPTIPYKAYLFSSDIANTTLSNLPKEVIFDTPTPSTEVDKILNATDIKVIDFDGDGKSELMVLSGNSCYVYTFSTAANGDVTAKRIALNTTGSLIPTSSNSIFLGDFNGDRKTDILTKNAANAWAVGYSTGRDFQMGSNPTSGEFMMGDFIIDDFDGNGMSDIAFVSLASGSTSNVNINFSKGLSFFKKIVVNPSFLLYSNTGDFNGDGKADMLGFNQMLGSSQILSLNPFAKNQLLEKVKNGFDVTTSVTYKSMTEGGTFYTKGTTNTYPLNSIQIPLYLAASVTSPDGIGGVNTTNYQYEDARIHRQGKGFLGFAKFHVSNTVQDRKESTEFEIITPQYVTALKKVTSRQLSTNTVLSETINTNSIQLNGNRYWQKADALASSNFLTGATGSSTTSYDLNGNITFTSKNVNNEEYTYFWYDWEGYNVFGTPKFIYSYNERVGQNRVYKQARNTYNSQGDILTSIDYDYIGAWQETTTTTNIYNSTTGSLLTTSLSSPSLLTKTTSFEYDTKHRYVTKTTNPLLQYATKTYNPKWGTVATETDIAGLTTTYTYDGFGRLTNSLTPQGHNIGVKYLWAYSGLYFDTDIKKL